MIQRYRPGSRPVPPTAFKKGQPRPENAGRKKGQLNKTTKLIKDAISGAGEQLGFLEPIYRYREEKRGNARVRVRTDEVIGWKPTGKGGTEGYLVWLGCNHPKAFASLMGRTLPLQIDANVNNNTTVTERFGDVQLSRMSLQEKMAAMREMIGLTKSIAPAGPQKLPVVEGEFTEVAGDDSNYQEAAE